MADHLAAGSFYGTVQRRVETPGALLSIVRHAKPRVLPVHDHERAYFCLLVDGDYEESVSERSIVYQPFTIVYHPAKAPHSDAIGARGAVMFVVEIDAAWLAELALQESGHVVELDGGAPVWPALRLYQEVASHDAPDDLTVESLLLDTCGHIGASVAEPSEPAWVARAAERVREGYAAPIDLRGLAREAGVHPVHLAKTYRRFRGRSVGEDVQYQRVQHACRWLRAGEATAEVALRCGFTDQSYFTRVFRRVTGTTPAAFRAQQAPSR